MRISTYMRILALAISLLIALPFAASAQERILQYNVDVLIKTNGDINIAESIRVNAEGRRIRRGIFRDMPRYYDDPETEGKLTWRYNVKSVKRNGRREPYEVLREGNAFRILIGDEDRFLSRGEHTYDITYRIKNAIRYDTNFDELYWNLLSHYWAFPVEAATITIHLPDGAAPIEMNGYSGPIGAKGRDFKVDRAGEIIKLTTTRVYQPNEGLTFSITLPKGVIDAPSFADESWLWWARNGALSALLTSLFGLFAFLYRSFDRVGRDLQKPPVFARYAPPEGYSPAAVNHIYHRYLSGHDALIASLMQLAVTKHLKIDVSNEGKSTQTTRFEMLKMPDESSQLPKDTILCARMLFSGTGDSVTLDGTENPGFVAQYTTFLKSIKSQYGAPYFKWNRTYSFIGIAISVAVIAYAVMQPSVWTLWHTVGVAGLVLLNGVFMYLMPAPSKKGQKTRTEIEGFKLYLEKAEKLQLNAAEVGGGPPPMSEERYEAFLPYAIALGVEKPWTNHFERLVPEASDYNPSWSNMSARGFRSLGAMNRAVSHGISSGVTSAMPSSSGSGSGGGGFSGGGGGGGGGGGW